MNEEIKPKTPTEVRDVIHACLDECPRLQPVLDVIEAGRPATIFTDENGGVFILAVHKLSNAVLDRLKEIHAQDQTPRS